MVAANAFPVPGSLAKMVQVMIEAADQRPAPKRLTLGRDAYAKVRSALVDRLSDLDAQQSTALSTEADD